MTNPNATATASEFDLAIIIHQRLFDVFDEDDILSREASFYVRAWNLAWASDPIYSEERLPKALTLFHHAIAPMGA